MLLRGCREARERRLAPPPPSSSQSLPPALTSLSLDAIAPSGRGIVDDALLCAIGKACPALARLSLRGSVPDEVRRWRGTGVAGYVRVAPADRATSPDGGWEAVLCPPRGLYALDLGRAIVARDSLRLLREHVVSLRCSGSSGTETTDAKLQAAEQEYLRVQAAREAARAAHEANGSGDDSPGFASALSAAEE